MNTKSRTYFFDVHESAGGTKYLTIAESHKDKNTGEFVREKIMIFSDNAAEFFAALDTARTKLEG